MITSFSHFILCRYNIELYNSNPYNIKNKDLWMDGRIPKFELLLKSLENQTSNNFLFVLFIDPKTPKRHKKLITETLKKILKKIKFHISETPPLNFFKEITLKVDFVITSRIDSDDEYLPKFVETIQEEFMSKQEVIDVKGCQYDILNNKKYTSGRMSPNSPFITLVENNKNIKTVFDIGHGNMCKKYQCRFVDSEEILYKQNIHENNLMNKIIGELII
jgi:hypothetical protein